MGCRRFHSVTNRGGRGCPGKKTEDKLTRSLHVRLDEESFKKLDRYAEDHGMDRSTAVRTILNKM
ncbi:hypothetical protein [Halobacillus litoralis]|uniref:hypothetical protein n=1 Tax=Halobacillus litoralis TaxID=45668 RepID=UPI001367ABB2|nr:hypothetical protein [Halobacillus litoralis]